MNIETYAVSGIVIIVPDIPVTLILDQLILIHLNIQQTKCVGLNCKFIDLLFKHLQGATARNSVEWFVFAVFCFVTTFAIVPEVSITLVMQ